ncbi:unnamed protein product [Xylocopa violacea]|uniref:Uncharacterized protein n=1 Tax=Xylocopa violacea TaxID=135666 RepID=A0ABP1PGD3_XYLVO
MDNNFLDLPTNQNKHENAPDLGKLAHSCLILKKKLVETDEVIKQYNDKLKECERLKQELHASKKLMIDYNSSLAKVIKLQMQNTEYKKNIETLSMQLNEHNIKTAADQQHIQQLICKIKDIEGGQNDKIMQYDLEKSSLQVKVKELEEELKNIKKFYDLKMKKEKKHPMENKSKLKDAKTNIELIEDVIMQKSEPILRDAATNTATIDVIMRKLKPELKDIGTNTALIKEVIMPKLKPELKDAGTNTTLTKDVIMQKPKVAEKCVLTDEFYTVKDDIYPIFCNKCEVLLDPPPLEKICKIMTEPCPKLIEKISSPVKKSSSPLQVSTDINSEQCKTEKLPTLDTPPPSHLQNHASNHTDFIPQTLLPSHTHTLNRTDYCNTFSPASNLINQGTYYIGSTPINHLPMTNSNATNQNNHCENIVTMASSLSLQKRVDTLEAKLKKLSKKSVQNNSCCRNHQQNACHTYDMNSSTQFLELCKTMMNFCNSKERKDIAVHKKSRKLSFETRKPKLSLVKRKRLQSASSCSWKVESIAQKTERNPPRKRPKKHKRRYCVPLNKSDNFSSSSEYLEKMDCESEVDLSTDTFDDIDDSKTDNNLESNSTSHVEPSTSTLKTNETGANEVGVAEVVQDLAECNKSGGEVDSGILSDSVESSKLTQLETDMDTCSELIAKKDLTEVNSSLQSESSSVESVKSVEVQTVDESTIKLPSHLTKSNESIERNNSLEILTKPDSVESDKLVHLAADLDVSSESIEQNNLMEVNSSLQSESSAIEDVKSPEAKPVDKSTIKVASHCTESNESSERSNSLEILSKPDSAESNKLVQLAADLDTSSESIEQNNSMESNSSLQSESSSIENVKSPEPKPVDESTTEVASQSMKFDESTKRNNSLEILSTPDSIESDKLVQLAADLDTSSESIEQNNSMESNSSLQSESSSTENVKLKKSKVVKSPIKLASDVIKSNELIKKSNNSKILSKPDSIESNKLVQLEADLDTSSESIEQNNLMEVNSSLQSESSSTENVKLKKSKVVKSPIKLASDVIKSNELIKKSNNSKILSKPDSIESNKLVQLEVDLDTSSESIEQNNLMEVNSSLQSESDSTENVKSKISKIVKSPVKVASRVMKSNESIEENSSLEELPNNDKRIEEVKQTNILKRSPNSLMAQNKRNKFSNPGVRRKRKISEVYDLKGCSKRQELLNKIKRLKKTSINSNIRQNILDQKVEHCNIFPEPKVLVQDIAKEENYISGKKSRIAHIPKIAIIERKKSFTSSLQLKKRLVQKVNNSNAQITQTNCVNVSNSQQNSENSKLQEIYSDLFVKPQSTPSNMPNVNAQNSVENTVQEKLIPGAENVLNTLENKTSLVTDINNYGCPSVSVNQSIKVEETKTEPDNCPKYLEHELKDNSPDIKEEEIKLNVKEITNCKEEIPIVGRKLRKYCPFAKLRHYINEKKYSTKNSKNLSQRELNVGLIADKFVKIQLQRLMDNEWQASIHWDVIEKLESTCSVRIIAKGVVEFLSTEEECKKTLDKTYTPPAPLMSVAQQRITALLVDLERVKPTVFEFVQAGIEYKLFRLNQSNQRCVIESLSRMYTILARIKKDREKVRIFCCDALYCLGINAICILYTVLTCWAEVFPNNETNSKLLSKCMAHLVMTLQATDYPKLNALKNLLSVFYKYPLGTLSTDILKELLTSLQENCRSDVETAIILLAKREGTTWTYSNVIKGALLPMIINSKLPSTYRAFCLLGNLMRSFPIEDKDHSVGQIIEQLCYLIDSNEGSNEQKEGVISALLSLSRHNFFEVVKNTLKWIPNLLIHDRTIEQIKGLINLRTIEYWKGYLRTNKLLDGYAASD